MSSRIIQQAVLDRLRQGPVAAVEGSLPIFGYDREKIDATILGLCGLGMVRIQGASNGNAFFGKDPEVFYLPQHAHLCDL